MPSQTYHIRGRHKVLKVLKLELHSTVIYVARTRFINTWCSLPNRPPTDFINIWTRSVLWSHMTLRDTGHLLWSRYSKISENKFIFESIWQCQLFNRSFYHWKLREFWVTVELRTTKDGFFLGLLLLLLFLLLPHLHHKKVYRGSNQCCISYEFYGRNRIREKAERWGTSEFLFFAEYFSASRNKEKEMGEAYSKREVFDKCSHKF